MTRCDIAVCTENGLRLSKDAPPLLGEKRSFYIRSRAAPGEKPILEDIRHIAPDSFDCPVPDCVHAALRSLKAVKKHLSKKHPRFLGSLGPSELALLQQKTPSKKTAWEKLMELRAQYLRLFPEAARKEARRLDLQPPTVNDNSAETTETVAVVVVDDSLRDSSLRAVPLSTVVSSSPAPLGSRSVPATGPAAVAGTARTGRAVRAPQWQEIYEMETEKPSSTKRKNPEQ